jgi:oligopeptidase B
MPDQVPPTAKKVPIALQHHGDTRIDDYYWLRDRADPEVLAYLEAENRFTDEAMKDTGSLQQQLYEEMLGRIQEDDSEVPYPRGAFLYYKRSVKGKAYPIHCRRASLDTPEQILLDENELAGGHDYFSVGNFEVSPNERLVAYSVDTEGDETYVTHIRDLSTGGDLPDALENSYYTLAWANDNRTLFFVTLDHAKRPYQVWRHELGQPSSELVFEETDERFEIEIYKSRDARYIFIESESKATSEVRFISADSPRQPFKAVWPRRQDILYEVEAGEDDLYILTNDGAPEFRLLKVSAHDTRQQSVMEVLPARPGVTLEGIDVFRDFLAIYERDHGLPRIRIQSLVTGDVHYVQFEEPAYTLGIAPNFVFESQRLRFTYSSLVVPSSVFEYDVQTRRQELLKQTPVIGYDATQYSSERIFVTARDGAMVPVSLVYRKGFTANGESPLLLYGYGSYGLRSDPAFRSERVSLLDRGFVFALAHIRGGADLGRGWYDSGKLLGKKNTFTDFIDCAEHLIQRNYTSPVRLVAQGGSAGGMLMGVVVNMRPELFKCVVAQVPFVDMLTTCLDPTLPLTIGEYEEWGNANDEQFYRYMKSYSPYDNVEAKPYPRMLVTAGLNDPRVSYWEPAKWVAKLRALKTDHHLLLLKTNLGAGHFGASGRYARLKEAAFVTAFVLKATLE